MENRPYLCPACAKPLIRKIDSDGLRWECEACHHWLTSLTLLKKNTVVSYANQLWQDTQAAQPGQGGACPVCAKPMALVPREAVCFQICVFCEMVWMGQMEKAVMPQPVSAESVTPLPPKAAEMLARMDRRMAQNKPGNTAESGSRHGLFWVLGIPSKPGGENWKRFPWMTLVIIGALLSANGFLNLFGYTEWTSQFSLWPGGQRSVLMPFFYVQGGFLNLVIGVYLLFLLGTSVENKVGPFHFLAIFVLPSLLGDIFSVLFSTHTGWIVGAGGGVAAVMVFFLFAFPSRKVFWRFANLQAGYAILAWFIFQFLFGMPTNSFTRFFYTVHIGGAFCGWGYCYFMQKKLGLKREPGEGLLVPEETVG